MRHPRAEAGATPAPIALRSRLVRDRRYACRRRGAPRTSAARNRTPAHGVGVIPWPRHAGARASAHERHPHACRRARHHRARRPGSARGGCDMSAPLIQAAEPERSRRWMCARRTPAMPGIGVRAAIPSTPPTPRHRVGDDLPTEWPVRHAAGADWTRLGIGRRRCTIGAQSLHHFGGGVRDRREAVSAFRLSFGWAVAGLELQREGERLRRRLQPLLRGS